ncbi:MAG: hypothetical protein IPH35_03345 [Rhodoferax sp.]|nr:hypothetical protein [Rhodoferax sp.]
MKKVAVLSYLFTSAFCLSVTSGSMAAPTPLSCNMQMMLHGMAAMERDRGVSRKNNTLANTADSDLTKMEIKDILDRVYIAGKSLTPDQIKDSVYGNCQNGR